MSTSTLWQLLFVTMFAIGIAILLAVLVATPIGDAKFNARVERGCLDAGFPDWRIVMQDGKYDAYCIKRGGSSGDVVVPFASVDKARNP